MAGEEWAELGFRDVAATFKGPTQNARVWTESWVEHAMFCPSCGAERVTRFPNNSPVADFGCGTCSEEYELKAQKGRFGGKVADGAWSAMTERLAASNNPNLLLLNYDLGARAVRNLIVVPKQFFTAAVIQKRKPLAPTARRAGWVGCNILLTEVPAVGKIEVIREGVLTPKAEILARWRETLFLREAGAGARGWLLEVLKCVERLGPGAFTLDEVYAYEAHLSALYPGNANVRPKIRQQLQVLRDRGLIEFMGRGRYRMGPRD